MILVDRKIEAIKVRKENKIKEALEHYKIIWKKEKSDWNGHYLALFLRKNEEFELAENLHQIIKL